MGDCQTEPLRPQFDRRLRLEFHGANVTSDAGLLAYRELDDALHLTETATDNLQDTRTGRNTRHGLAALVRQSLFSRLAGYEDFNEAQRLRVDPAMRTVMGGRGHRSSGKPRLHPRLEPGGPGGAEPGGPGVSRGVPAAYPVSEMQPNNWLGKNKESFHPSYQNGEALVTFRISLGRILDERERIRLLGARRTRVARLAPNAEA